MFPESAKARGHLAELMVATEAAKRGLQVLYPGGDNLPFDLVFMSDSGRFYRVQVKSCMQRESGRNRWTWTTKLGGPKTARAYTEKDIDFLALLAYDSGTIYLVPVSEIGGKKSIKITDGCEMERFKNNWEMMI